MKELLGLIDEENLLEVIRSETPIARISHLLTLELISLENDRLFLTPKGRDLLTNT